MDSRSPKSEKRGGVHTRPEFPQRTTQERDVLNAIRRRHLKANIDHFERMAKRGKARIYWKRAWIDPGGTIFGPGPYLKVPVWCPWYAGGDDETVHRVYPPARLRRQLAKYLNAAIDPASLGDLG